MFHFDSEIRSETYEIVSIIANYRWTRFIILKIILSISHLVLDLVNYAIIYLILKVIDSIV